MTRILVVEDEQDLREEIVDILGFENYETFDAENGRVGVEMARLHKPDLIVSDIMMPQLDGYEMLMELRSDPTTETIPFLFLTAKAERTDMRKGMVLGADDYLVKPFKSEELLDAIHACLQKRELIKKHYEGQITELRQAIAQTLPHELRTPITAILGYSVFISEGHETMPREKMADMANSIYKAGMRLNRLVENYLLYAQLELMDVKSEKVAQLKHFYVANPAYPATLIKLMAQDKGIEKSREDDLFLAIHDVPVQVSSDDIKKITEELLDNAFKFSTPGTPVQIEMTNDGKNFCLVVADRGRGMEADMIEKIDAYVQFNRKIYEQQGAGLGLSLVKRIVNLHGGQVEIESALNEGTTVRVIFPML